MTSRSADLILQSLKNAAEKCRAARAFVITFPWLILLCLSGAMVSLTLLHAPAYPILCALIVFAEIAILGSAWRVHPVSLAFAATRADEALGLPDTFSAYVEYSALKQPGPFHQAHLNQVRREFPRGISWRPAGPPLGKSAGLAFAVFLWIALALRPAPETPRGAASEALLPEAAQETLRKAAKVLQSHGNLEISVSLENLADARMPADRLEKERLLRRLLEIERELTSAKGRLAGQFLADLLEKSAGSSDAEDEMVRALRAAQWERAAEAARGRPGALPGGKSLDAGAERDILEALRAGQAQVKPSDSPGAVPPPSSEAIRRKLAGLAGTWMNPEERQPLEALEAARKALLQLAGTIDSEAAQQRQSGSDAASGHSPPLLGGLPVPEVGSTARKESVTPRVSAGPGDARGATRATQDSGIAAVQARPVRGGSNQTPPAAVTPVGFPSAQGDLVRGYFERLENFHAEQEKHELELP